MNYYALQVKTQAENEYIDNFKTLYPDIKLPLFCPQRSIDSRKKGKINQRTMAVFPGYIFIEAENNEEIIKHQWEFRRTGHFYRFLKSNQEITPLSNRDLEIVLHFIKNVGPVAGRSRVYFNENSRIVVVDGPLKGLEGKIVKVDKRKGRAIIRLDLYEDSFTIDFSFEVISSLEPFPHKAAV
jgi:transcriptional antiterminator NusG